jgi:hypothetical protein
MAIPFVSLFHSKHKRNRHAAIYETGPSIRCPDG